MFCPSCGAETDEHASYCSSCGAALPGKKDRSETRSLRERVRALAGPTRATRLLTIGTVVAVLGAIVAFFALPTSESDKPKPAPQDAYTRALDSTCVQAKSDIAASQRRSLETRGLTGIAAHGDRLVVIVEQWRATLQENPAPANHAEQARALESALRQVAVEAGALSRIARGGSQPDAIRQAAQVDRASEAVERAILAVPLPRCSHLKIRVGAVVKR